MPPIVKPKSTKSIKLTYDMSEFIDKAKKLARKIHDKNKEILVNVAPDFSAGALKYTPPNIGKNGIEKRLYERPIFNIIKLLRGEYHRLLWHKRGC